MTAATTAGTAHAVSISASSTASLFVADTAIGLFFSSLDSASVDALEVMNDPAFLAEVHDGLGDLDAGRVSSFRDVFGEPL